MVVALQPWHRLLSIFGEFRGGLNVIPFGCDIIAALLLSGCVYLLAVHCRLAPERVALHLEKALSDDDNVN